MPPLPPAEGTMILEFSGTLDIPDDDVSEIEKATVISEKGLKMPFRFILASEIQSALESVFTSGRVKVIARQITGKPPR